MQTILKVNPTLANKIVAVAVLIGMPFFTVFGALSDRIGRKKIIMAGCLIAVLTYIPIYKAMEHAAGNNVVSLWSTRNAVTGAISLTAVIPHGRSVPNVYRREFAAQGDPRHQDLG